MIPRMVTLDEDRITRSSCDVSRNDELRCLKMVESVFEIFNAMSY